MSAVRSVVQGQDGNTEAALLLSEEAMANAASKATSSVSSFLLLRSGIRAGLDDNVFDRQIGTVDYTHDWNEPPLAAGLRARISALEAQASLIEDSANKLKALSLVAAELHETGDIGGLGLVLNSMGVLARRAGHPKQAELYLRRAIPLLIVSGDIFNLQAALFNLGHAIYIASREDDEKSLREALKFIELDREIRRVLGLGKDSAQAEIVGINLAIALKDIPLADQYLRDAERLVGLISNSFEQAGFNRARAKMRWVHAVSSNTIDERVFDEIARDLRIAEREFRKAGHSVPKVVHERQRAEAHQPPFPGLLQNELDARLADR